MTGTTRLRATQVLHCNLNVVDVSRAASLYERGLSLTTRMRSESTEGDSTPLGIDEATHSIAWFLYDHRGGHRSPAIELVEWRRPPTAGVAYEDPTAIGMQALAFGVPSVPETAAALVAAGASPRDRTADSGDLVIVEAELLDLDGVRIELNREARRSPPTFAGVRISCADLDESTHWYGALGWEPIGDRLAARWSDIEATATIQRVALPSHPFELHLTEWGDGDRRRRAHDAANTRGLYRMALAVDDVRGAYDEASGGPIEMGEPTYVPLPGTPLGGLWVSFFRDPSGVTVELVERATGAR